MFCAVGGCNSCGRAKCKLDMRQIIYKRHWLFLVCIFCAQMSHKRVFLFTNIGYQLVVSVSFIYIGLYILKCKQCLTLNFSRNSRLMTCGATRNPEFPRTGPDRTGPDRTETGPGSGNIFKNIFWSSRVGEFFSGRSWSGNFISGWSGSGYFLPGHETFSPGISGINLPFIPKLWK